MRDDYAGHRDGKSYWHMSWARIDRNFGLPGFGKEIDCTCTTFPT